LWRWNLIWLVIFLIHKKLFKKNWKSCNPNDVYKKKYDNNMNSRRVIIKNVFGSLKNRWQIMKNLNYCVNRALPITITCVLHNYCEMRKF
jgi:hypothetical protein